jgi:CDP-glucose 4,6-dehydratase
MESLEIMLNRDFWNNKSVIVTGHTGFKGSWLVVILKCLGAKVYGYSKDIPTSTSFFEIAELHKLMDGDVRANLCSLSEFKRYYESIKPDIVLHLAAQSLVRASYDDPVETFNSNIMGTVNVLESIRASTFMPKACLIVTTDKCYRNDERMQGYSEDDPLGGHDPYSASKACAELVTAAYRDSFFNDNQVPLVSARAGNVIGGGDYAKDRIIPDLLRAINANENIKIRNPAAIRPWQHVIEPLVGYLRLVEKVIEDPKLSGAFNFGPNSESEKNVDYVSKYFLNRWGASIHGFTPDEIKPHEASILKLDVQKTSKLLNLKSLLSLSQALDWTVDWYKAASERKNMLLFSQQQINRYLNNEF